MTVAAIPVARRNDVLVTGLMPVAAVAALLLATRAPLATTVLGLILFGVLHNVLEIRYVAGRFASVLTGDFLFLLVALISGIVICRATASWLGTVSQYAEIVIGYAVLAVGAWRGLGRHVWLGLLVLAGFAVLSLGFPAYHFVVLAHLHNLVPLVFLWEWARRMPVPVRGWFRAAQLGWVVVVPALILAGAADRWLGGGSTVVRSFVGDGQRVIAAAAPPGSETLVGLRFLAVFAFLQTMHYVVWVGFLPRFAPDASRAFETRVPWLRGRRAWYAGLAGGAFLAVLFVSDYFSGRALYGALASYHAYIEFPVLLALLMGVRLKADT